MGKTVEVVFIETKKKQYHTGQQKQVKMGFAINYLIPQSIAVLACKANYSIIKQLKKKGDKTQSDLKIKATAIQKQLNGKSLYFSEKSHDEGKLYGSVSPQSIVDEINKQFKVALDKDDLSVTHPFKEVGIYTISVDFHTDVTISITVTIEGKEDKKKATAKKSVKEKASNSKAETKATEEAATEEAVTEEAVTEEAVTEEAVTEEAVTEEAATEEAVTEEAVTPKKSAGDKGPKEDSSVEG